MSINCDLYSLEINSHCYNKLFDIAVEEYPDLIQYPSTIAIIKYIDLFYSNYREDHEKIKFNPNCCSRVLKFYRNEGAFNAEIEYLFRARYGRNHAKDTSKFCSLLFPISEEEVLKIKNDTWPVGSKVTNFLGIKDYTDINVKEKESLIKTLEFELKRGNIIFYINDW